VCVLVIVILHPSLDVDVMIVGVSKFNSVMGYGLN